MKRDFCKTRQSDLRITKYDLRFFGGVAFEDGEVFFYACWVECVEVEAFVGVLVQLGVKTGGDVFAGDEEDGDVFFHGWLSLAFRYRARRSFFFIISR